MSLDDEDRRSRLAQYYLASPPLPSQQLHDTVALAANAIGFPHAQVNILDDVEQHTIADHHAGGSGVMARNESMCHHTIASDQVVAVPDLRRDARSKDLPGVVAGRAASYVGVPLHSREATAVGTLCLFDTVPRVIDDDEIRVLTQFGRIVEDRLDLLRRAHERQLAGPTEADSLAAAIGRDEIVAWFQPIVDLRTGAVVGHEALARWQRRDGDVRPPSEFVPLAEDSDLIIDMDRAVMRHALEQAGPWRRGNPELRLGLNISTRHLDIPGAVAALDRLVTDSGYPAESITFEITETHQFADPDAARAAVQRLRERGYDVILDDFGSGWSSLDWVLSLPVSGLKIDRAVTAALGSASGDAVINAVAGLARDLDLRVVVEGVDNESQVEFVRSLGLQFGQGYFWSPPLPAGAG